MPKTYDPKQSWPPEEMTASYTLHLEHAAWWSGDPLQISMAFEGKAGPFWGKQVRNERKIMLHVPVAGDISGTSAALLIGEHPIIRVAGSDQTDATAELIAAQERLEEMFDEVNMFSRLIEAAETCSCYGGVYIKLNWDSEICGSPIPCIALPDSAVPEFKFGLLTAVTFWKALTPDGDKKKVYRLLERHERGKIFNTLYVGSDEEIGIETDLINHKDTADLEKIIDTGLPGLACVYIPNMRPNKRFRGSSLGESDYSGSEGLFDSIDETYTSWIREIRMGQGRIIAPAEFFDYDPDEKAFSFDLDKSAYVAMRMTTQPSALKDQIALSQFAIRSQEYYLCCRELLAQAYTNAGYSTQSFGLNIDGRSDSGTALRIRERKSVRTTAKKAEYWRPAIGYLAEAMLILDYLKLSKKARPAPVQVEMQDGIPMDIGEISASVELLARAQKASTRVLVKMQHPDWTDARVDEEVEAIMKEYGMSVPNPDEIGIA